LVEKSVTYFLNGPSTDFTDSCGYTLSPYLSMMWCTGRVFSVVGGSLVDVGVTLSGKTSMTFQVQAAQNAHVALTPECAVYTDDNMYEIVLGSTKNKWTVIRQVFKLIP